MSTTSVRRRLLAASLAAAIFGTPLLTVGDASGDPVADKLAEARQIAARLDAVQQRAEILAERYNDARIRLADVDSTVIATARQVDRTRHEIELRRRDLARYAVAAYTSAGNDDALTLALTGNPTDYGARRGYAAAAVGTKKELIDALKAARSDGEARVRRLRRARSQAARARADLDGDRWRITAAIGELTGINRRVQGELGALVAAEQARRGAEEARRAEEVIRRAAASGPRQAAASPPTTKAVHGPATTSASAGSGRASRAGGAATVAPRRGSPAPPAASSPAVGNGAGAAIAAARSQLGVRYTWGGASPSMGFDCSGLVMWAWQHGGKSLPHSSQAMYSTARRISVSALQPGDLLFYGSPVHHVALYIGGGQIIHAPHTGDVVKITSMSYWSDLVGAGRV